MSATSASTDPASAPETVTATKYWGVDSVATVTQMHNGVSLRQFVHNIYGEPPNFWGRYFASPGSSRVTYSNAEGSDLRHNGTNHVLPIQSPDQSRLGGSTQTGQSDATAVCQDIAAKIGADTQWPAQSP